MIAAADLFRVLEELPAVEEEDASMRCPRCGQHTPDNWQQLGYATLEPSRGMDGGFVMYQEMHCANAECGQLVVTMTERRRVIEGGLPTMKTAYALAYPRAGERAVDRRVPDNFRRDFEEASVVLEFSPRMSAVLSRRLLADLLAQYAGLTQFSLSERVNKFEEDSKHPSNLRENLHYLREIADFGAHTQTDKDDQATIIDVGREEAEWTLTIIERLFDYFIVGPERDKAMRAAMDEKIKAAGRKPLTPADQEAE